LKVAVKIMENIGENIEEIDEEFLVYRDLCLHPNIPSFFGIFLKSAKKREDDQLWFVMEVSSFYPFNPLSFTGRLLHPFDCISFFCMVLFSYKT